MIGTIIEYTPWVEAKWYGFIVEEKEETWVVKWFHQPNNKTQIYKQGPINAAWKEAEVFEGS